MMDKALAWNRSSHNFPALGYARSNCLPSELAAESQPTLLSAIQVTVGISVSSWNLIFSLGR
jgi:hypothetical protein